MTDLLAPDDEVLEHLALVAEAWRDDLLRALLGADDIPWVADKAALARLRAVDMAKIKSDLNLVISAAAHGLVHSILAGLDERGLIDPRFAGPNEMYVDHLSATGRLRLPDDPWLEAAIERSLDIDDSSDEP